MKSFVRNIIACLFQREVIKIITKNELTVVAVAGSVGKTTTKQAIASVLSAKYKVLVHEGNYNSQLSLPLTIFELEVPANLLNVIAWLRLYFKARQIASRQYPYEVVVLELGTDHPGEIADFSYLKPHIGVITAIAPEHMDAFITLEAVADEEFSLAEYAQTLVLNETFDELKNLGKDTSNVLWYSDQSKGFDQAKEFPAHIQQALSAGVVVAEHLGLSHAEIATGLASFEPVAGRMCNFSGVNGSYLIDDTYNSSPTSVEAALKALYEAGLGRKIALLGQMNELGTNSPRYHEEIAKFCTGLDMLITLTGDANSYTAPAAISAGLAPNQVKSFNSPYEAGKWLRTEVKAGDFVLIKGSQNGVFAEEVTKLLLTDPVDAKRLVRQSEYWQKRKAQQFGVQ